MRSARGRLAGSKLATMLMAASGSTAAMLMQPSQASATVIYSENFNEVASNSASSPTTGYAGFDQIPASANTGYLQIQGGGGGTGTSITAGADGNGVGPSQALFGTMDASQSSSYLFFQIQGFNMGNAPTDAAGPSAVQVSFDMSVVGANPSTPGGTTTKAWSFEFVQGTLDAATYSSTFTPTLTVDGNFTHVVYTLDEGTQSGNYSPTALFSMQGSALNGTTDGYNFAAGDTFHLDNLVIQTISVPEPASILGINSVAAVLLLRRRQKTPVNSQYQA